MRFEDIENNYDLVIIGGGITGAGILREAAGAGLKTLLVEKNDFAWGSSSRSSKMVHGGLRYLRQGKFSLTRDSVHERDRLMAEVPGLVEPLDFLWPIFKGRTREKRAMKIGLFLYDLIARRKDRKYFDASHIVRMVPSIKTERLECGYGFTDAQVDDARLVLRLIMESKAWGGKAVNYVRAVAIERNGKGSVAGIVVRDTEDGQEKIIHTPLVINATGFQAEAMHPSPYPNLHLRPLRGSHLVFPLSRLPISQAISFLHPEDKRPIFAVPWEGITMVGTTDLDHRQDFESEPFMEKAEAKYLIAGIHTMFPDQGITLEDCTTTWSGVRSVLSSSPKPPSRESREHGVWADRGLVTVTGGKLTTFRVLAHDALKSAAPFISKKIKLTTGEPVFSPVPGKLEDDSGLDPQVWRRLLGRYGNGAKELAAQADKKDLELISGTKTLFAEIPFAARTENIRHLTDLLLRRVRMGVILKNGGIEHLARIRRLCEPILPWDEKRWVREIQMYLATWQKAHSVPL